MPHTVETNIFDSVNLHAHVHVPERVYGVRQRLEKSREVRAERRYARDQIGQLHRERNTPAFAVLEGVDPENEQPPPYINVRTARF